MVRSRCSVLMLWRERRSTGSGKSDFKRSRKIVQELCSKAYFRYCDDTGGNGNLGTLTRHWKFVANQKESPHFVEGWVVSYVSRVFLDTEWRKGPRWKKQSKIDSRTHTKQSSLRVPLSPQRSHPKWVHNWWSLGESRRFARISTQHNDFINTKNQFIQRLEKFYYDATVVDKCKNIEFTKTSGVYSMKTQTRKHPCTISSQRHHWQLTHQQNLIKSQNWRHK